MSEREIGGDGIDPPPPAAAEEPQRLPRRRRAVLLELVTSFYGVALLLAAGALWLFGWLASEVLEQEMVGLNSAVLLWIHGHATPGLESLAFFLSWLGSFYGSTIVVLLFGGALLMRRRTIDVFALAAIVGGATVLTYTLKEVFRQVRPQVFPPLAIETSFSFPSGHSLTSFCLWGFIAAWIVMQAPRELWRWAAAAAAVGVAVMIAASRMYLGVHWPTDVTAGMLIAIFWVAVCVSGQRWLMARRTRRGKDEG